MVKIVYDLLLFLLNLFDLFMITLLKYILKCIYIGFFEWETYIYKNKHKYMALKDEKMVNRYDSKYGKKANERYKYVKKIYSGFDRDLIFSIQNGNKILKIVTKYFNYFKLVLFFCISYMFIISKRSFVFLTFKYVGFIFILSRIFYNTIAVLKIIFMIFLRYFLWILLTIVRFLGLCWVILFYFGFIFNFYFSIWLKIFFERRSLRKFIFKYYYIYYYHICVYNGIVVSMEEKDEVFSFLNSNFSYLNIIYAFFLHFYGFKLNRYFFFLESKYSFFLEDRKFILCVKSFFIVLILIKFYLYFLAIKIYKYIIFPFKRYYRYISFYINLILNFLINNFNYYSTIIINYVKFAFYFLKIYDFEFYCFKVIKKKLKKK